MIKDRVLDQNELGLEHWILCIYFIRLVSTHDCSLQDFMVSSGYLLNVKNSPKTGQIILEIIRSFKVGIIQDCEKRLRFCLIINYYRKYWKTLKAKNTVSKTGKNQVQEYVFLTKRFDTQCLHAVWVWAKPFDTRFHLPVVAVNQDNWTKNGGSYASDRSHEAQVRETQVPDVRVPNRKSQFIHPPWDSQPNFLRSIHLTVHSRFELIYKQNS